MLAKKTASNDSHTLSFFMSRPYGRCCASEKKGRMRKRMKEKKSHEREKLGDVRKESGMKKRLNEI